MGVVACTLRLQTQQHACPAAWLLGLINTLHAIRFYHCCNLWLCYQKKRRCRFTSPTATLDLWVFIKRSSLTNAKGLPSNHSDLYKQPFFWKLYTHTHTQGRTHKQFFQTDTFTQPILAGNPRAVFKRLVKPCLSVLLQPWQESTSLGVCSTQTHTQKHT